MKEISVMRSRQGGYWLALCPVCFLLVQNTYIHTLLTNNDIIKQKPTFNFNVLCGKKRIYRSAESLKTIFYKARSSFGLWIKQAY